MSNDATQPRYEVYEVGFLRAKVDTQELAYKAARRCSDPAYIVAS